MATRTGSGAKPRVSFRQRRAIQVIRHWRESRRTRTELQAELDGLERKIQKWGHQFFITPERSWGVPRRILGKDGKVIAEVGWRYLKNRIKYPWRVPRN